MNDVNLISPFMGVFGRNTKAGVGITKEGSLGLSAVYAAINKISSTLASLPLNLYRQTPDGKVIAKEQPAFVIINSEPNERDTAFKFIERMLSDALMYGVAYASIERGEITGRASQLHPLDPEVMRADVYEGQQIFRDTDTGLVYYPDDLFFLAVGLWLKQLVGG